ncbi:MAG TPA: hypothetical protein VIH91_06905 [Terriglobales bacterium]
MWARKGLAAARPELELWQDVQGARAPAYKNVAAAARLERQSPATVSTDPGYSNFGIALN